MKHLSVGMLNHESMLQILVDTYLDGFKGLLQETETEYGETQYWLDLPYGRQLEITQETEGLAEDEYFWSWRVHCSDEEFDDNCYQSTCGCIDKQCTEENNDQILKEMLFWAIKIAVTEFED